MNDADGQTPNRLWDAVSQWIKSLDQDTIERVRRGESFGNSQSGKRIREAWSLEDCDSELVRDVADQYGIEDAQDISGLILAWGTAELRGEAFDPGEYISGRGDHWHQVGRKFLPGEQPNEKSSEQPTKKSGEMSGEQARNKFEKESGS
ncbi:MAG: hypothetical protein AAF958_17430 [Planctomycetota bacterium]